MAAATATRAKRTKQAFISIPITLLLLVMSAVKSGAPLIGMLENKLEKNLQHNRDIRRALMQVHFLYSLYVRYASICSGYVTTRKLALIVVYVHIGIYISIS